MTNQTTREYNRLVHDILIEGEERTDRTGVGTRSVFGRKMEFDLTRDFPLYTGKRTFFGGVVDELLWFLSGSTNVKDLPERSRRLWALWAWTGGELGPIYGQQWRSWGGPGGVDQIARVVESIRNDPFSRRHVVSAWNTGALPEMALAPCHVLFQFYVRGDGRLDCQLYQRSADVFLGLPFNIASYALLTHMVAHVTGLQAGTFHHVIGDAHLYSNHILYAKELVARSTREPPRLWLDPAVKDIDDFRPWHIEVHGYAPHPAMPAPVAV